MKVEPLQAQASSRPGYALLLVVVTMLLFTAMLAVVHRQAGAALRVESVRTLQQQRDEGSMAALARGLALLETGAPPATNYVCGTTINTSKGALPFTLTFTYEGKDSGDELWRVRAAPTADYEHPDPMPNGFLP